MQFRKAKNAASPAQKSLSQDRRKSTFVDLWRQYSWYMLAAEVLLIAMAGYWLFVGPKISSIRQYDREASAGEQAARAQIADNQREISALRSLISDYESLTFAQTQSINEFLPDAPSLETVFSQIESMAKNNGLLLSSIALEEDKNSQASAPKRSRLEVAEKAPSAQAEQRGVQTVSLTVTVDGAGYPSLKNFLSALENNLRLIDVQSVNYDPVGGSVELTFSVYYLGLPL